MSKILSGPKALAIIVAGGAIFVLLSARRQLVDMLSPRPEPPSTANVAGGPRVLVSDYDANGAVSSFGTKWGSIDDKPLGGKSSASVQVVDGGANGTPHGLKISGQSLLGDFPYPFAGAGLPLVSKAHRAAESMDLSSHQGISFRVKGDGKRYLIGLQTEQVQDFNMHHFLFTAGPEWTEITVFFSALQQYQWGKLVPWTGTKVSAILIMTYSEPGDEVGAFELMVDDIAFF